MSSELLLDEALGSTPVMDEGIDQARPRQPRLIQALIAMTAGIAALMVIGIVTAGVIMGAPSAAGRGGPLLAVVVLLAFGLSACGLMIVGICVLRKLSQLSEQAASIEHGTSVLAERSVARQAEEKSAIGQLDLTELPRLMTEIRDILLLPEEHRQRRFEQIIESEFTQRLARARQCTASRDFHHAREELNILAARFGEDDRIREARGTLERVAKAAEEQDIVSVRRQIQDFMGLNRWDEAEKLARELTDKYPSAPDPVALIEHVCRERQVYEQRQRVRILEEIQGYVHQRRWKEAAEGTRQFLVRFPVGPDADNLRTQIDTLEANAEIQIRQQLENQFKDCLKQQQYWDALALARRIVTEYPFSPQANALRGRVARLEELARTHQPQR
ncbi:MAG: hypothetical protein KA354_02340 [Phycisphaerae bacterium]|nr:hypothetical protein [Phycisphaerae bacterium]